MKDKRIQTWKAKIQTHIITNSLIETPAIPNDKIQARVGTNIKKFLSNLF